MFIVMHCGGLPFNGETILKESLGGSETAAYYMAKQLAEQGHSVTLFTNSENEGTFDGVRYVYTGKPTRDMPLGQNFHFYATNTPHDVSIIQRHPQAFAYKWASKINLWWLHDLATVTHRDFATSHLWNIDAVLTVSEFHKQQIHDTWGIDKKFIEVINNGIDLSLFNDPSYQHLSSLSRRDADKQFDTDQDSTFRLLYTSRPERGLDHLVKPNGIMERLAAIDSKFHLYVCGYQNPHQNSSHVDNYTYGRCEQLDNVTLLGQLTKQELADVMRQADLHVYPIPGEAQPNFQEVSCITMMECMAAGLPVLTSEHGALPETCYGSGVMFAPLLDNGFPDLDAYISMIQALRDNTDEMARLAEMQLGAAKWFTWEHSARDLLLLIKELFEDKSAGAVARHAIRMSDIRLLNDFKESYKGGDPISTAALDELDECYSFMNEETLERYYHEKHTTYAKEKGIEYGPQSMDGNPRFEYVDSVISDLHANSSILDYGCAHGHFTVNLAKRHRDKFFVGVDISESNVQKAAAWASDEGISNAVFVQGSVKNGLLEVNGDTPVLPGKGIFALDAIIAAEVMEHVLDPADLVNTLNNLLDDTGKMILTTPTGPWEDMAYEEHWNAREHIDHFEREDLHNMFSQAKDLEITMCPQQSSHKGLTLGSYISVFTKLKAPVGAVNYERKLKQFVPIQTVSLCMIVKDAEQDLLRCLESAYDIVDELIIGIDDNTTDKTERVVLDFIANHKKHIPLQMFNIAPALETGFDEARNTVIEEATGDWILWLDADEVLVHSENIHKYLRRNQFNGYAVPQHHFAAEPAGILKTDYPCKLFRNFKDIEFFGMVHEHPAIEMNDGPGHVRLVHDFCITHSGYSTEDTRRARFRRNIGLMVADRKKYPDRTLGKFLWVRDLTMLCQYEMEMNGGNVTENIYNQAAEAVELWDDLLDEGNVRMLLDSMEFYAIAVSLLGAGFEGCLYVDAAITGEVARDVKPVLSMFYNVDHFKRMNALLIEEKTKDFDSRYK